MSAKRANRPDLRLVRDDERLPPLVQSMGFASVGLPDDEEVIVKEVPCKVDGVVVGTAQVYESGRIGVILDDDAPPHLLEMIKADAGKLGYSIGGIDGSP
jgi:hypothetical protein